MTSNQDESAKKRMERLRELEAQKRKQRAANLGMVTATDKSGTPIRPTSAIKPQQQQPQIKPEVQDLIDQTPIFLEAPKPTHVKLPDTKIPENQGPLKVPPTEPQIIDVTKSTVVTVAGTKAPVLGEYTSGGRVVTGQKGSSLIKEQPQEPEQEKSPEKPLPIAKPLAPAAKEPLKEESSQPVASTEKEKLDDEEETSAPIAAAPKSDANKNAVQAALTNPETFIYQVPPRGTTVLCQIVRKKEEKSLPYYELSYEEPDSSKTLLLNAKKKKKVAAKYIITAAKDSRESKGIGKLKSNFIGTGFTFTQFLEKGGAQSESAAVLYEANLFGFKGPRKMTVLLPKLKENNRLDAVGAQKGKEIILDKYKAHDFSQIQFYQNKQPVWSEETRSYVLNFNGRVTLASVKNFQVINDSEPDRVVLQFGRIAEDTFTMDYQSPLTALQAFAVCLSSFDSKLACE